MLWSDVREYGEVQIWLPVDATIDINIGTERILSPVSRRAAVEALEAEIVGFGTYLAQILIGTRTLMEVARTKIDKEPLIPWLPMIQSAPEPNSIDCRIGQLNVDVSHTLTEQLVEGGLTYVTFSISRYTNVDVRPIVFVVDNIIFVEGSLKAKVKAAIGIITVIAPLTVATFCVPQVQEYLQDRQFERHVTQQVQGQKCEVFAKWQLDLESLRKLGPEMLNYEDPNISKGERALRVCYAQLSLQVSQGSPYLIDGMAGGETNQALRDYARRQNLPPDIRNETLRALLMRELQRYRK